MNGFTLWQQLHSEWTAAKLALDVARTVLDARIHEYLTGGAKPPGPTMISEVEQLITQEKAAREVVDALIAKLPQQMAVQHTAMMAE
jgi:hypothetical protein